jgi:hypothetical protein
MRLLRQLLRQYAICKLATKMFVVDAFLMAKAKLNASRLLLPVTPLVILVITATSLNAQEKILTLDNVLDIVRRYHPIAKQTSLSVDSAKANRLAAQGAFDPAFYISSERKTFDGRNYYFYTNPELKIPTWYGIDFKAGIEDNGGERLAREVTAGRSSYAGPKFTTTKKPAYR